MPACYSPYLSNCKVLPDILREKDDKICEKARRGEMAEIIFIFKSVKNAEKREFRFFSHLKIFRENS